MTYILFFLILFALALLCVLLYNLGVLVISYWLMRLSVKPMDIETTFEKVQKTVQDGYYVSGGHEPVFWKDNTRIYIKHNKIIQVEDGYACCFYIGNFIDFVKFVHFIQEYQE